MPLPLLGLPASFAGLSDLAKNVLAPDSGAMASSGASPQTSIFSNASSFNVGRGSASSSSNPSATTRADSSATAKNEPPSPTGGGVPASSVFGPNSDNTVLLVAVAGLVLVSVFAVKFK